MKLQGALFVLGLLSIVIGLFLFMNNSYVIEMPTGEATTTLGQVVEQVKIIDIEPQMPLANPPEKIKAIYATSWSAASSAKLDYLIKLINDTELNAIVIDVKDYSGYVAYNTDL